MDDQKGNPQSQKEKLEALRERLYARDSEGKPRSRAEMTAPTREVPREWGNPAKQKGEAPMPALVPEEVKAVAKPPVVEAPQAPKVPQTLKEQVLRRAPLAETLQKGASQVLDPALYSKYVPYKNPSRNYRVKILLGGFIFFGIALLLSSFFLLWGNKPISGENISIGLTGPFAAGGGEEISIQIAVANQNTVPIESATLIIEYPAGTQSAENPGQELFQDRRQLDVIKSGEVLSIPVRAIVFGEENSEKIINVSVEYRVEGSNAIFYKEAEPLRFKISSSPVVLLIDSVRTITSGQETEIKLTVGSNAPTTLSNVLVKAVYPFGFDFSSADPKPDSAKDTWLIGELRPEEKKTITLKGIVTGKQNEDRVFNFSVGVPNERDRFSLSSVYTNASTEIALEEAFLGVDVTVNGQSGETVTISNSQAANVRVTFKNTLEDTVYDGSIQIALSGNALSKVDVDAGDGYYDSRANTITWDGVDELSLKEIAPGKSSSVTFTLRPEQGISQTPEIGIAVTAKGQRVYQDRVPQELVSTAVRTIKVESLLSLGSSAQYSEGEFNNNGPVPPVVDERTTFGLMFAMQNGSNEVTNGEMTAVLPQYVEWLGNVSSGDDVTYQSSTRTITWRIGDMNANATDYMSFQIAYTPSANQVGKIPTLIETQRFKATDRFTSTTVRAEAPALTTALPEDGGVSDNSGRVRASE